MSWKGFKKAVNRLPHQFQSNMGMVDQSIQTKDEEFDFYKQQFEDLNALTLKLQDASAKYKESVAKMLNHQVSFAKTMVEVYEEIEARKFGSSSSIPESSSGRWGVKRKDDSQRVLTDEQSMDRVKKLVQVAEVVQESISPQLDVVIDRTVVQPCLDYIQLHKLVNKVLVKRDHKKVDLDRHQADLKKVRDKVQQENKIGDDRKIAKAEHAVENAYREYDQYNALLKEQLPHYINYRIQFVDPILHSLLAFHSHLFIQMYQIMYSDKGVCYMVDTSVDVVAGYEYSKADIEALIEPISLFKGLNLRKGSSQSGQRLSITSGAEQEFDSPDDAQSLPPYSPPYQSQQLSSSGTSVNQSRSSFSASSSTAMSKPPAFRNTSVPVGGASANHNPFITSPKKSSSSSSVQKPPRWNQNTYGASGNQQQSSLQAAAAAKSKPPPPKPKPTFLQDSTAPPPLSPRTSLSSPPQQRAVALYEFTAQQDGDLSFQVNDVIEVLERTSDPNGWWKGRLNGKVGVFPGTYVKLQ
ncbi:hypothetical protein MIR68_000781 [Amoeboaphelidium protococcarum]|nr:hypothetical protein MIR68_000781 [Amoeboaphelidium protococcarum]